MGAAKVALKFLLCIFFVLAGLNHFINPAFYLKIMPPYIPLHPLLVQMSGFFEILFGIALVIPRWTRIAAWGLILLLIAVFPANIHMALHANLFPDFAPVVLWIRLPLQAVLILWAYWYTQPAHSIKAGIR